jgi:1-acyl-sn-glycerol-3-phosphate acyltransferase
MIQKISAFILYRLMGWRLKGSIPWKTDRLMLVLIPHTSNWDFVVGMLFIKAEKVRVTIYGKDAFYFFPFNYLYDYLGVVPVRRKSKANFVQQASAVFDQNKRRWVAMAPEGTRSHRAKLKSGYYYLAKQANLPIVAVGLCFQDKILTVESPREIFDSFEEDSQNLIAFAQSMRAKRPGLSV